MPETRSMPRPMSPGTYLRKRREAHGLSVGAIARLLIALPAAERHRPPQSVGGVGATEAEVLQLTARLGWIESDRAYLAPRQAETLRLVLPFDPEVYLQLALLHALTSDPGEAWGTAGDWGLPVPHVCRECACSYTCSCLTAPAPGVQPRPCTWAEDDLCTACERAAASRPAPVAQPSSVPARAHEGAPA